MARISAIDRFDPGKCVIGRAESEDALTAGQVSGEARILCEHGTATSKIARAAITKPSAARHHVSALGDSEFGFRPAYESLILLRCFDESCGFQQHPAIPCQCVQITALFGMNRER